MERGAYVLADGDDCILIGTGSEVHVALAARELLAADGISARVVSMPSFELFRAQEAAYRDEVLPPALRARVAVEAASPFGWDEWVGIDGAVVGDRPFRRLRAGRRGPRGAGHHRGGGGGGRDGLRWAQAHPRHETESDGPVSTAEAVGTDAIRDVRLARTPAPAAIVIFGATGDLTQRKLHARPSTAWPSSSSCRPRPRSSASARSELTDDEFRARMRAGVEAHGRFPVDDDVWDGFARRLRYMSVPFNEPAGYRRLRGPPRGARPPRGAPAATGSSTSRPPRSSSRSSPRASGRAGLAEEGDGDEPFARLVIEKPFGADLASARELNSRLNAVFRERQVYRIDHYLGKETVQNILVLRFGNAIFEPIWNRRYVDHVQITVAEDLGVGTRGGYYDRSGALRDIVQNHMLQVLSIVAMEPPARFESREVRDEKVKVLRAIPPFDAERRRARRGARPVRRRVDRRASACRATARRRASTPSPTPRRSSPCALTVDNWRWSGTPFYLRTGKRLPRRATEVAIQFKPAPHLPFASTAVETVHPNLLVLRIQPDEGASLRVPGQGAGPADRPAAR